jgi:hypothetical protein
MVSIPAPSPRFKRPEPMMTLRPKRNARQHRAIRPAGASVPIQFFESELPGHGSYIFSCLPTPEYKQISGAEQQTLPS